MGTSFTNFDCELTEKRETQSLQQCEQLCKPEVQETLKDIEDQQHEGTVDDTEFSIINISSLSWKSAYESHASSKSPEENSDEKHEARDIYTVVKAELVGDLTDEGECSEFGVLQGLFNEIFGNETNEHATLTAIVSQQPILGSDFSARGFAIPLLQFEKTLDGGCKYTRELNRSETLARLRSDGELNVLVAYTYNEGFKILENLAVVADGALGGVMNGAIGTAAPVISQIFGDEISFFRETNLKEELTISLSPKTDDDAYLVNVPLGTKGSIRLRIFQDAGLVSSLADLKSVTSLTDAINSARVLEVNQDNSINPVRKSFREQFGGTVNLEPSFFSNPNTNLENLSNNCANWRAALANYGMTNYAVNRLMAFMEREYWLYGTHPDHAKIGQVPTRCVDIEQFSQHKEIVQPDIKPYGKNCQGTPEWVSNTTRAMDSFWRQDPEYDEVVELLNDGVVGLRPNQIRYAYSSFASTGQSREDQRQADYVEANLSRIAKKGCWHSLANSDWVKRTDKGYCHIAYALFPDNRNPIWVELNIDRTTGNLKNASVGIDIQRYIDFTKRKAGSNTSARCAREINRQREIVSKATENE